MKPNNGNAVSETELKIVRKQAADYAMALDSMAKISYSAGETETVERIMHLFEMLFLPKMLYYLSIRNGEPHQVYSLSTIKENETTIKNRLSGFKDRYAWTDSRKGFQVKIKFEGTVFGILEIGDVEFPEYKDHYLNLTLSLVDVCGLAIENARRYQTIKDAEARLSLEKTKLEQALSEIKTLSGLLPICANCKKIRDDSGYWDRIEAYISKHSDAKFTHSICPECAKKLYPDLDLDVRTKRPHVHKA